MKQELKGECLCGTIRFHAVGEMKRVSACYCRQCRIQNGGGPFFGAELKGDLNIEDSQALVWYASSEKARRAFCGCCGTSLFWQANDDKSFFDISLGVLDEALGLTLDAHIFVDSCPSYMIVPETAPHLTEADVLANPLNSGY